MAKEKTIDKKEEAKKSSRPARAEYFCLLLYPDCKEHFAFLNAVQDGSPFGFRSCWILHDKDSKGGKAEPDAVSEVQTTEDCDGDEVVMDDLKKAHVHMLVKMPYPMTLRKVKQTFAWMGIRGRFVQMCSSFVAMSLYMTHSDPLSICAGKYRYKETEIRGDLTILGSEEDKTFDQFKSILDCWAADPTAGWYFVDCVQYLSACGFYRFIKSQGYVCTRSIEEVVRLKQSYRNEIKEVMAVNVYSAETALEKKR